MDKAIEVWKDIPHYGGKYQVSNLGRIWSVVRQQYKSTMADKDGYLTVTLYTPNGKTKKEHVHRLVALCFCDKPDGCDVVNHLDCNRQNNNAENLEWTTVRENTKWGYDHGDVKSAQQKATEAAKEKVSLKIAVYRNGEYIGTYKGKAKIAALLGISEKTIYNRLHDRFSPRGEWDFREVS